MRNVYGKLQTDEAKAELTRCFMEGRSKADIARDMEIPYSVVDYHSRKRGLQRSIDTELSYGYPALPGVFTDEEFKHIVAAAEDIGCTTIAEYMNEVLKEHAAELVEKAKGPKKPKLSGTGVQVGILKPEKS